MYIYSITVFVKFSLWQQHVLFHMLMRIHNKYILNLSVCQYFAANDYVSACTATIKCDVPLNGWHRYILEFDEPFQTYDGKSIIQANYNPCGKEHEVGIHGNLLNITITDGRKVSGGSPVPLDEPINCYLFVEYNESGLVRNFHCTLGEDGFQSNKS